MRRDVLSGTSHGCFEFTMVDVTSVVTFCLARLWFDGLIGGSKSLAVSPSLTNLFFFTAPRVIGGARAAVVARARVTTG